MKTVEEKRLERIRAIWEKLKENDWNEDTEDLRSAMFEEGIPICLKCGKLLENARDTKTKKISGYLWKCECSPNMKMSIG